MMFRIRGGRGVMEEAAVVGTLRAFYSINQVQMRTRGEGSKNRKNLRTCHLEAPLHNCAIYSCSERTVSKAPFVRCPSCGIAHRLQFNRGSGADIRRRGCAVLPPNYRLVFTKWK